MDSEQGGVQFSVTGLARGTALHRSVPVTQAAAAAAAEAEVAAATSSSSAPAPAPAPAPAGGEDGAREAQPGRADTEEAAVNLPTVTGSTASGTGYPLHGRTKLCHSGCPRTGFQPGYCSKDDDLTACRVCWCRSGAPKSGATKKSKSLT